MGCVGLADKVAVVTGGGQGIGRSIVQVLAAHGADIAICDLSLSLAQEAAKDVEALGRRSLAVKADVSQSRDVEEMVKSILAEWEKIDILINNAGVTRDTLLIRMKEEDWTRVMDINVKGAFHCMKAVLPSMIKQRKGKIVSIASIVGVMGNAGQTSYSASKAALLGLTKSAAREYASRGITVNAVAPGFIQTAMTDALSPEVKDALLRQIPLARFGTPNDVSNAVLFLVSDVADYMTGQVIHVNGGMWM